METVQNKETPLQMPAEEGVAVCREVAVTVFDRIMKWNPLREAATIAANLLIAEMENADFFTEHYALTERQQQLLKNRIYAVLNQGADSAVANIKDYAKMREEYIGRTVIEELMKIPEETMKAIGQNINRGALLAMQAVAAKATHEDFDEVTMRKSKITGDITIPTRGVFISTNCVEKIKTDINFLNKEIDVEVK